MRVLKCWTACFGLTVQDLGFLFLGNLRGSYEGFETGMGVRKLYRAQLYTGELVLTQHES